MFRNLAKVVARGIQRPLAASATPFPGVKRNMSFFASTGRHPTIERIQSGVDNSNIGSILSDMQALGEQDQKTALHMILNTVQRQQVPVAVLLHQKFVAQSQKYPNIFIEGRVFLAMILTRQLSQLMLDQQKNRDKITHFLTTINDSYKMCYEQLQKVKEQEKWRYHTMLDKKYSDYYLIYLSKYVANDRKEADLKRCADIYRKGNEDLKYILKDLKKRIQEDTDGKGEVKKETLTIVELYAQNVLYLNQIARDIYEIKQDEEYLKKESSQTSKQIGNVLQQYKIIQELIPSSVIYNQLQKTKLTADYYLSHQKLVETKASEEEMEKLKKKVAIDLGKLHEEIMTRYEQTCLEGKNIQRMWDTALTLMTVKTDQLEKEGLSLEQFREALKQEQQAIASKIADKDILNMVTEKLEANVEYIMKFQQWRTEQSSPQERKDML